MRPSRWSAYGYGNSQTCIVYGESLPLWLIAIGYGIVAFQMNVTRDMQLGFLLSQEGSSSKADEEEHQPCI